MNNLEYNEFYFERDNGDLVVVGVLNADGDFKVESPLTDSEYAEIERLAVNFNYSVTNEKSYDKLERWY